MMEFFIDTIGIFIFLALCVVLPIMFIAIGNKRKDRKKGRE